MLGFGSHGIVTEDDDDPNSVIKRVGLFRTAETNLPTAIEFLAAESIAEPIALLRARSCYVPNIVKLDNIWLEAGEVCMRLEKLTKIDLESNSDEQVRKMIRQLFEAVSGLHKAGIYHCDIKTENLMVASTDLRVIDFGLAHVDFDRLSKNIVHLYTKPYRAPEIMLLQHTIDLAKTDTWAAAVCAAELMLKKEYIFGTGASIDILSAIMSGVGCAANTEIPSLSFWDKFNERWDPSLWSGPRLAEQVKILRGNLAADFIHCALKVAPSTRLIAESLLQHPYLSGSSDPTKPPGCNWLSIEPNYSLVSTVFSRYDKECAIMGNAMLDYMGLNKNDPKQLLAAIEIMMVYRSKFYKFNTGFDTDQPMITYILTFPRSFHFLSMYHVISI